MVSDTLVGDASKETWCYFVGHNSGGTLASFSEEVLAGDTIEGDVGKAIDGYFPVCWYHIRSDHPEDFLLGGPPSYEGLGDEDYEGILQKVLAGLRKVLNKYNLEESTDTGGYDWIPKDGLVEAFHSVHTDLEYAMTGFMDDERWLVRRVAHVKGILEAMREWRVENESTRKETASCKGRDPLDAALQGVVMGSVRNPGQVGA